MRMVLRDFMGCISTLLIIAPVALAEDKKELKEEKKEAITLEEIVVTATKTEKKLEESPVAVSVISSKDIERSTAKTVDEVLKNTPGTFYWNRTGLGEPHAYIQMRGFKGSNRNLALIDGLPLNDASGGFIHWMGIPISNIEKVEQVRGPFSALYGGYAMGGVTQYITKTPQKREINAGVSYGSDNTQIHTLRYGDKFLGKLGFALGYEGKMSDGYPSRIVTKEAKPGQGGVAVSGWQRTRDPLDTKDLYIIGDRGDEHLRQDIFYGKVVFDITPKNKISFNVNHTDRSYEFLDYHTYLRDMTGKPVDNGAITINDNGTRTAVIKPGDFILRTGGDSGRKQTLYSLGSDNEFAGGVKVKLNLGSNDLQSTWHVSPAANATLSGGAGEITESPNKAYHADLQADFPVAGWNLVTAGFKYGYFEANSTTWSLANWTDTASKGGAERVMEGKSNWYALYVQDEILLHEKVTLYLGGRYDFWKVYDGEFLLSSPYTTTNYPEKTQGYFSPKTSIHYQLFKDTVLRGSTGKAFRPPTIDELYKLTFHNPDRWIYGNPDLKPEVTTSWEVGLMQKLFGGKTRFSTTYFESYVDDLIAAMATKTDPATGRVIETRNANISKAKIRGIEAEVKQEITPSWSAFANFTWQDAKTTENLANRASEDKMLTLIPEYMANVGLIFLKGGISAGVTTRYASKVYSRDDNLDTATGVPWGYDPIFTTDLKVSYQFIKWAKASLEVNNVFDREYYYNYEAPGRTIMGTLALTF